MYLANNFTMRNHELGLMRHPKKLNNNVDRA